MAASPQVYMRQCPKTIFIPSASKKPQSESVDSLCGFLHGSEDENGKRASPYLYFAALRSFDSVLPFQISHFLTYDVFLRSG